MKKLLVFLAILAALALTGCATGPLGGQATSGGAAYTYDKQVGADGVASCTVTVTSARDVAAGDLEIGEGCTLRATAERAGGADAAMGVVGELVRRLPVVGGE